jgi:hypothetical protein
MGLMDNIRDAASQVAAESKANFDSTKLTLASEKSDAGSDSADTSQLQPLFQVMSHIAGAKNATVRLWPDRIEWERKRGVSASKLTAGVMTAGASLLLTGVKGGKDAYDMVLLEHVTNVSNRKDGLLFHIVEVQTASGGAINVTSFRVSREEAAEFRKAILKALSALKSPSPPTTTQAVIQHSVTTPDFAAQLQQLAALRDSGVLTQEEFEAKKVEILSRI